MTISSTTNRVAYTGNGVTIAFSFPYKFLENADLLIYLEDVLQVITTDYTVTGAGDDSGGTVTFVSAPALAEEVVILRSPAITQGLDLVENDPLPAEDVENAFDKVTMICQRLQDQIDRSIGLADSVTSAVDVVLPAASARKALIWNATADGVINSTYDPDEQATLAAASAAAASASASSASTSASNAATSETNALAAEVAAEAAQAAAEAAAVNAVLKDGSIVMTGSLQIGATYGVIFEGTTADAFETTLVAGEPTVDRTVTLPNGTTTLAGLGVAETFTAPQRGTLTTDNDGSFDQSVTNNFACTPTGAAAITFTNHTAGQSGLILFVNGSNYAITAAATTYIAAADLTKLSATGTYLIAYLDNGTNAYCTVTAALTSAGV